MTVCLCVCVCFVEFAWMKTEYRTVETQRNESGFALCYGNSRSRVTRRQALRGWVVVVVVAAIRQSHKYRATKYAACTIHTIAAAQKRSLREKSIFGRMTLFRSEFSYVHILHIRVCIYRQSKLPCVLFAHGAGGGLVVSDSLQVFISWCGILLAFNMLQ